MLGNQAVFLEPYKITLFSRIRPSKQRSVKRNLLINFHEGLHFATVIQIPFVGFFSDLQLIGQSFI